MPGFDAFPSAGVPVPGGTSGMPGPMPGSVPGPMPGSVPGAIPPMPGYNVFAGPGPMNPPVQVACVIDAQNDGCWVYFQYYPPPYTQCQCPLAPGVVEYNIPQ
jgi:hypothetical protein